MNVRKHAGASVAAITVTDQGDGIALRVEDDGVGFRVEEASGSAPGRMGLTNMRERAEIAGGTFEVRSGPSAGTSVDVRLPL
jgi:signal transduction histidine kinase